ncbi:hypothetical protein PF005_g10123 [Phytophthora fragariae]|uniref:Uncharacterized protein n=1 Tax=Phytophthora fragariae TaxID=53985 RepID=A0A6A3U316_9STRA|nr:hypothetical protein PF009_g11202 [Phytophthora fragariae]KAE9115012.1 hypothetical protein PF007_g10166 [Phytophthora fragariae]KAE9145880.1 hypothetical protein PF006_g9302 [Phytophthora fragariae]KAE9213643.1 hypothetical protein PF005_g10123 [Phytophthora fragariae]KAE9242997.1 hypothetical protein PF002_g8465 [Phytophthora fragariae]
MGQRLEDGMEPGPPDPGIHTEHQQALAAEGHEQHAHTEGATALAARGSTEGDAPRQRRPATKGATDAARKTDESAVPDKELEQDVAPEKSQVLGNWSDKVRTSASNPTPITAEMARNAHMLDGVWNPLHIKQLIGTLMTDWNGEDKQRWTVEEVAMRMEAQMPAQACCDESVRDGTVRENEILMAYLGGGLDLPHPPNFIKAILIGEHQAMLEDMHEAYFNVTLTAVVPTTVRSPVRQLTQLFSRSYIWLTQTSGRGTT